MAVKEATGAFIQAEKLQKKREYEITDYGASPDNSPVKNTEAINTALCAAAEAGGGTVVIPAGEFKIYTIVLQSNVNIRLEPGAVLRAARTDICHSYEKQRGEGGNYLEPEVNLYAGLQDHGHSYFANSLFYAYKKENIMIYGKGLLDGSYLDEETGYRGYALLGGDPFEPYLRNQKGHTGEWFGNKGMAFVHCKNIVLSGFSFVIGGHFAIIAEGVKNMRIEHLLVDTTRDALDLDCCQDVTVVHSAFNSLTDDALVVKASFGAGEFLPSRNILIEDCVVSGYDAGSVYAGLCSRDKLVATDCCGPTGRVKLGTESTCGYEQVTVRRVRFERSRGFALEAVDGSDLKDILFEDCVMDNVSSSPIFIRAGERGRFPVTGNSRKECLRAEEGNVRVDNVNWVLPDTPDYHCCPARRYTPAYRKDTRVTVDGHSEFYIVNQKEPAVVNEANLLRKDGMVFAKVYDEGERRYRPDFAHPLQGKREEYCCANACGSAHMARVSDIVIRNVAITNADPRYPILLMGLTDSPIRNVSMENITVTYRGGLKMEHAVEQRQLHTNWEYTQYGTASMVQTLPWLVNPFFLKEEGLLPRVDWDAGRRQWQEDPYNVPELPGVYPEPSNWGILPAYGIYARHVENLKLSNITLRTMVEDERHAVVFDDLNQVTLKGICVDDREGVAPLALVTNHYRRPTNREYIPEEPYFTTRVTNLLFSENEKTERKVPGTESDTQVKYLTEQDICAVSVNAPAPGTPRDCFYEYPTVPVLENGYRYKISTEQYPLPLTVYRPFFSARKKQRVKRGEKLAMPVDLKNPATQVSRKESEAFIYNEKKKERTYTVPGIVRECKVVLESGFTGAYYEEKNQMFYWDTKAVTPGDYTIRFSADDGVLKEFGEFEIEIIE